MVFYTISTQKISQVIICSSSDLNGVIKSLLENLPP